VRSQSEDADKPKNRLAMCARALESAPRRSITVAAFAFRTWSVI
jgi:hypothetical protein